MGSVHGMAVVSIAVVAFTNCDSAVSCHHSAVAVGRANHLILRSYRYLQSHASQAYRHSRHCCDDLCFHSGGQLAARAGGSLVVSWGEG